MEEKNTILVVDDTPENIDVLFGVLSPNYKVKAAPNGLKALKIAQGEKPPDLILLDIMMPEMDGYEVCRRLKEDERTRDIPVIFVTAKTETEDENKGFQVGAVDYIIKPISPPIVKARVRTHLALKRARRCTERPKQASGTESGRANISIW
jgi:putative two-component system response regulator